MSPEREAKMTFSDQLHLRVLDTTQSRDSTTYKSNEPSLHYALHLEVSYNLWNSSPLWVAHQLRMMLVRWNLQLMKTFLYNHFKIGTIFSKGRSWIVVLIHFIRICGSHVFAIASCNRSYHCRSAGCISYCLSSERCPGLFWIKLQFEWTVHRTSSDDLLYFSCLTASFVFDLLPAHYIM